MEANIGAHASPYLSRELSMDNESVKQPLREAVLKHFLEHHEPGDVRCFGLPGERWAFETMLSLSWDGGSCKFIAVERESAVIRRALGWMPRVGRQKAGWQRHELQDGYVDYVSTNQSAVLHCDLHDFARITTDDHGSKERSEAWWKMFRGWTCAWFDLTTMLHPRFEATLGRVDRCFSRLCNVAPFAVTLLAARESRNQTKRIRAFDDERVTYVARILDHNHYRSFTLDDAIEYTSVAGCPMLLIMGRAIVRPEYRASSAAEELVAA